MCPPLKQVTLPNQVDLTLVPSSERPPYYQGVGRNILDRLYINHLCYVNTLVCTYVRLIDLSIFSGQWYCSVKAHNFSSTY